VGEDEDNRAQKEVKREQIDGSGAGDGELTIGNQKIHYGIMGQRNKKVEMYALGVDNRGATLGDSKVSKKAGLKMRI
jgi:hypothetical protein